MADEPERLSLPPETHAFYGEYDEAGRLERGANRLEFARTLEFLGRFLPPPPAVVLDVGGGTGAYALPLARRGYRVHLVDAMPHHVEAARRASEAEPGARLEGAEVGDARRLSFADASADAVLLLGPLYHLTERTDRLAALREARRVLRQGGVLLAAGVSRFASTLDGLLQDFLTDPEFAAVAEQDRATGQHRNPSGKAGYFTTTYFHHPDELREELEAAGLRHEATLAVEGPAWLLGDFEARWADPERRARLLDAARWLEAEPSLLGASAHLMAVGAR